MTTNAIKVWVDVYPEHLKPGAAPPVICQDEPDYRPREQGIRIAAIVEVRDESMMQGLSTSFNGEIERAKDDLFGERKTKHEPRQRHLKSKRVTKPQ